MGGGTAEPRALGAELAHEVCIRQGPPQKTSQDSSMRIFTKVGKVEGSQYGNRGSWA